MASGFSKRRPLAKGERERLLFFAAAGLVFSLIIVVVALVNYKSDAAASGSANSALAPTVGTITLFVPERAVKAGEKLSEAGLRETLWPRNQVPEGAIRDRAEVKDVFARVDLPAGIPLQRDFLTTQPSTGSLPVTPGNRAVSIEVDATSGIEGLALPGSHVDVALTYSENGELTSKIIVSNARVLASGGDTKTAKERGGRGFEAQYNAAKTITLDVSTKDSLKINTSRQLGRLSLLMRSADDTSSPDEEQVDSGQITGGSLGHKTKANSSNDPRCVKGFYKANGFQYQINCDGTQVRLDSSDEP